MTDVNTPKNDRIHNLVQRLRALSAETPWVEFKTNFFRPGDCAEYVSALANGAALSRQDKGYLVWGVQNGDHELIGTEVNLRAEKVGNEDFLPWLARTMQPQVHFEFHTTEIEGKRVAVLIVDAARTTPIRFKDNAYIRVESYNKKLHEFPEHERRLWDVFQQTTFEDKNATEEVDEDAVLNLLDVASYFQLMDRRPPVGMAGILEDLERDSLISKSVDTDKWTISSLGAILFARDLNQFPSLQRKAIRIIRYRDNYRLETEREQLVPKGYAAGFDEAITYLNAILPSREIIGEAIRRNVRVYPDLAVRELLANALIHQDFSQTGNGPMIEVFDDRVEITSPGAPLVPPTRFVDAPPKSRNEKVASLMRRAGICEERGSGWDKIAALVEISHLPAPRILVPEGSTRVILFGPKPFLEMDKSERLRAVYLHACLRYVSGETLTNSSLRDRFQLDPDKGTQISRLIGDAVSEGLITPVDPAAGTKYKKYLPTWAVGDDVVSL